jgi:uncharacterized membrane protein
VSPAVTELLDEAEVGPASGPNLFTDVVIASYPSHTLAEAAVRRLSNGGVPVTQISIVGRHFETHEEVQGFYRPVDVALAGAGQGAWYGGLFGLLLGAFGFFVLPLVGGLVIMGPFAGLVAGAIGGAGAGALLTSLTELGVPHDHALRLQRRLQAGEFVVTVHGSAAELALAHTLLAEPPTPAQR